MEYITGRNRVQLRLFPECIDDYVSEENPVRVIDAFVDAMDMQALGFEKAVLAETGRPPYDPRDLLKLYIYGYLNRIRSSRRLMKESQRNLEVMFLLNHLTPDFRTIADFRKNNKKAIQEVFREFVRLCIKLGLYKKELLSVDGSKFRAVNSKDCCYNKEALERKLLHIESQIAAYMNELEEADRNEVEEKPIRKELVQKQIEELKARQAKYQGYQEYLIESGETQLLTTDPEARRMHSKDGFHCCYNVQTAVDTQSHLIADYEVTNHNTDQGLLTSMMQKSKELLDVEVIEAVADKGYESREDILNSVYNGIVPNVIGKYDIEDRFFPLTYKEAQIQEEDLQSTDPDSIRKCLHAGYLPRFYENTALRVEMLESGNPSCFVKQDERHVICPMGNTRSLLKKKGESSIYRNKDACRQCPNRCTSSQNAKEVSFGPHTQVVPVQMYGSEKYPLQSIPEGMQTRSYNHTMDRTDYRKEKIVMLRIRPDGEKYKLRKCTSEHPFGTVKWYDGAHYFLCKGKEKVSAEIGLSYLTYNLRRAIHMIGTKGLIEGIRG